MKIDPQKTALLTLDIQKGVFGLVPGSVMWGLGFPRDTRRFRMLNPRGCGSKQKIFSSRALPPWNFTAIFFIRTTS